MLNNLKQINMKTIVTIAVMMISMIAKSQEFMGVRPAGKKYEILAKFKAKGFHVTLEKENTLSMEGTMAGKKVELIASFTPISKTCWAFFVYLPVQNNWYDIKTSYQDYVDILTQKYGTPKAHYEFFTSPYYEGDGYEMSAIALEKCTYFTHWDTIAVSISEFKQIKIQYENKINRELKDREMDSINSTNL
jgi:hypothetical protein